MPSFQVGPWIRLWILKPLAIALIGLSLLGIAGCQPVQAQSPVMQSSVMHLTLWHGINPPSNRDVFQRLVDQFNQSHPDIQVESLYVGQADQQMPKILASVVGAVPPHLLWFAPTITGQLVELDAIRPLDDWWATQPLKGEIDPALRATMEWERHLWSIPFDVNNVGIFYRPSLFQAAGISQLPQTWEELRQVAHQLTHPETGQYGLLLPLGKGEWTVFNWLPFLWSAGGDLLGEPYPDPATSAGSVPPVELVNPGAIAALQLWQDLIRDGSALLSQPERGYELNGFLSGQVAMQLTGPWTLADLQASGVDYAVMPIPAQVQPATSIGGENLFVFKTTPEAEQAALTFAEYVLSEAFQTEWAMGTGYLPVNLRSRQSQIYQAFVAQLPAVQVFLQQAPYGRSRPIFAGYNRVSDTLGRAIESVLLEKATPRVALEAAQQRLRLLLSAYY